MTSTGGEPPDATEATWLPPLPPPEPSPPRRRIRLTLALVAVVALALGTTAVVRDSGSGTTLAVGDCLDVLEGQAPPAGEPPGFARAEQVGCDEAGAAYRIAILLDGPSVQCPSEVYTQRSQSGGPTGVRTLCLTYNVDEGGCFTESATEAGPFDCALGPRDGAIKILRVITGVEDADRCADLKDPGLLSVTVPEPAMTFCYVEFLPDASSGPVLTA